MGKYIFDESDLDDETAIYIDKYFKKVIINAEKQYLGRLAKDTRIILNSMEENRINKNELCNIEDLEDELIVTLISAVPTLAKTLYTRKNNLNELSC